MFQIWLNLPPESKMVDAYFGMLWSESIPTISPVEGVSVDLIAGSMGDHTPPSPPPDSWASQANSDLAIWLIRLSHGASWDLPPTSEGVNRMLHCFLGDDVVVDDTTVEAKVGVRLEPTRRVRLENRGEPAEFLLLQGRPIACTRFPIGPVCHELSRGIADCR